VAGDAARAGGFADVVRVRPGAGDLVGAADTAAQGVAPEDVGGVDGGPAGDVEPGEVDERGFYVGTVEPGPAQLSRVAGMYFVRVQVAAVDGDTTGVVDRYECVLRTGAVDLCPPDRVAADAGCRPVDRRGRHCHPGRGFDSGDEVRVGAGAVDVGPPDRARFFIDPIDVTEVDGQGMHTAQAGDEPGVGRAAVVLGAADRPLGDVAPVDERPRR